MYVPIEDRSNGAAPPRGSSIRFHPLSPLGHGDSRRLSLHADQLADCLLADPVWQRVPSAAAPTTPNTKASSSSDSELGEPDELEQMSKLTD